MLSLSESNIHASLGVYCNIPVFVLISSEFCSFRYLIAVILFWRLQEQVDLSAPSLEFLQLGRFIKNGENLS